MNNYDFDNPWEENEDGFQQGVTPGYEHQYGQYAQYEQNGQMPVAPVEVPKKATSRKGFDIPVIAVLVIAVVIAGFFAVKKARQGTSIFEATIPSITINTQPDTQAPPDISDPAPADTSAPVQTTQATSASDTAQPTQPADVSESQQTSTQTATQQAAQSTQVADSAPDTQQILKAVSDGINSLKDPGASFKGTKTQKLYIQLTECSVAVLVEPANKVLDYFAGEEQFEFDFTAGKATDPETGEEISSATAIPPTDKPFALTAEGVANATYEQVGDKKVYKITVVPESSNLASPRPPHHDAACDTLDFSAFELPVGEITRADFEYPGAEITVTLDSQGRIVEYHEYLPTKGVGEGKLGLTASGSMEGYIDEKWTIEWK